MTKRLLDQLLLCIRAVTWDTPYTCPMATSPGGGCLAPDGAMNDTAGSVPAARSLWYSLTSTIRLESAGSLMNRSKLSNGTQTVCESCGAPVRFRNVMLGS